jgi:phosphohistidine phosphatase SixA
MTPAEIAVTTGIISSIFTAGATWGIMRNKTASNDNRISTVEVKIEEHERADVPHLLCASHASSMSAILSTLTEIKTDVKVVAAQVFTLASKK